MTKASNNPFPSILVAEGTTPASPSAGDQRLFIDTADHKLKRVNSSGTVTTVEGAGSGSHTLQLDSTYSGADISSSSLTAATWTDLIANQSFSLSSGSSLVLVSIRGLIVAGSTVGNISTRLNIDSAGTPVTRLMGGTAIPAAGNFVLVDLAGVVYLSGLAAGSHTIKPQLYSDASGNSFWLRPSARSNTEYLSIQVLELT